MNHEYKKIGQRVSVSVATTDDGDILIGQTIYPLWTTLCIPMSAAVLVAKDILKQANEFAGMVSEDDLLHLADESNFAQERE